MIKLEDLEDLDVTTVAVQFKNVATGQYIVLKGDPRGGGALEGGAEADPTPWHFYQASGASAGNLEIKRRPVEGFNWSNYKLRTDEASYIAWNHAKRIPTATTPAAPHDWTLEPAGPGVFRIRHGIGEYLELVPELRLYIRGSQGPKLLTRKANPDSKHQLWEVWVDKLKSDAPATRTFVIEVLGRRGLLEFPLAISRQPTAAKLTLYGLTTQNPIELTIEGGAWSDRDFTASVAAKSPILGGYAFKLRFADTYRFVGILTTKSFLDSPAWIGMHLVLGHDLSRSPALLPPAAPRPARFATVVFDRESSENSAGVYDYGWWIEPSLRETPNFRALTLLLDNMQDEVALYGFANDTVLSSNNIPAFAPYKLLAYKFADILAVLKGTGFVENAIESDLQPDLIAFLLGEAMRRSPSDLFGIASGGHGSPDSIMNGMLGTESMIRSCFTQVTQARGRPIDFLDFGTNCNAASLINLQSVAPFVKYVLASDLLRNSPSSSINRRPDDGPNYSTYFAEPRGTVPAILGAMMDCYDRVYNDDPARACYAAATPDKRPGWKEQLTLFDCSAFAPILAKIGGDDAYHTCKDLLAAHPDLYYPEYQWTQVDFKTAIPVLFPAYTDFARDWSRFAIKQINNRASLTWNTDAPHGLTIRRQY